MRCCFIPYSVHAAMVDKPLPFTTKGYSIGQPKCKPYPSSPQARCDWWQLLASNLAPAQYLILSHYYSTAGRGSCLNTFHLPDWCPFLPSCSGNGSNFRLSAWFLYVLLSIIPELFVLFLVKVKIKVKINHSCQFQPSNTIISFPEGVSNVRGHIQFKFVIQCFINTVT